MVMKKVEAVGICDARMVATEAGFSTRGPIDWIRPDVSVTTKNVCYLISWIFMSWIQGQLTMTRNTK